MLPGYLYQLTFLEVTAKNKNTEDLILKVTSFGNKTYIIFGESSDSNTQNNIK